MVKQTLLSRLFKDSVVLVAFNFIAGFCHYFYQVVAARRLNIEDLALLNVELAFYSLLLTLGVIAQYFPVFRPPTKALTRKVSLIAISIFALTVCYVLFVALGYLPAFTRITLVVGAPIAIMMHYWLGVFQSKKRFFILGLGLLFLGLSKFIFSIFAFKVIGFAFAVVGASMFVVLFSLLIYLFQRNKIWVLETAQINQDARFKKDLTISFFNGLGFVLFPVYDLINVKYFIGVSEAGRYAQLQLFSKILYFAPVALLQVTLPHRVQAFKDKASKKDLSSIRLIEKLGLVACYMGALFFGATGPWISKNVIGINGISGLDVFLACAALVPLYGLLNALQIFAAAKKQIYCFLVLVSVAISPIGLLIFGLDTLREYLIYALFVNTILGVMALYFSEKLVLKK